MSQSPGVQAGVRIMTMILILLKSQDVDIKNVPALKTGLYNIYYLLRSGVPSAFLIVSPVNPKIMAKTKLE